jgi:hypothetical protein
MAKLGRKLALLAAAAEAARRYAQKNPDKAGKYVDQAAQFVDKQTKGKYRGHLDDFARKAKGVAGIPSTPGYGAAGGVSPSSADFGSAPTQPSSSPGTPPTVNPGSPTPTSASGQPYPGPPSTAPGA